jgi:hypothetical protein
MFTRLAAGFKMTWLAAYPIFTRCSDVQVKPPAISILVAARFATELGAILYEHICQCHDAPLMVFLMVGFAKPHCTGGLYHQDYHQFDGMPC